MIYDLTTEPLLSAKAKALLVKDVGAFNGQVDIAETYLGLIALPVYTGDKATLVKHFLAQQVNWQIEIGLDPLYIKAESSTHSQQAKTYRDNLILHPGVALGFQALVRTWGFRSTVRTLR